MHHLTSAFIFIWGSPSVCVHVFAHAAPLYKGTIHWTRGPYYCSRTSCNLLHLQWPYFQIRSHSGLLGVRTLTYEWGVDTIQPLKSTQPTVTSHSALVSPRLTVVAPRPESDWGGRIHSGHLFLLLWDCRAPTGWLRATWTPGSMNLLLLLQYRGQK